jgi:PAS domain S-box-containing protein
MVDMGSDANAAAEIDLRRVVNALPALVWTTQDDGRSDFVNRHWCDYTGLGPDVALDHGWQKAIHPDDLTPLLESWSVIRQSGVTQDIDGRLRRFDGEYRWFVFRPSCMEEVSGRGRWCWLGLNVDESAASLDGRLRRFFDMLPWQAGFLNAAGVSEFSNLQALRDFGMSQEELAQWTSSGIIHVDDHERNYKSAAALLATGELFDEQMRMLYPGGAYRWTRARCVPVRDAQGNIVRYVTFQIDVDDLKRAEDLLAAEVKLLELVARGEPLNQILDARNRLVEELCKGWSGPAQQQQDLVDRFGKIADIAIERARADTALRSSERELRQAHVQLIEGQRLSKTGSFTSDLTLDQHRWSDEYYRIFEIDPTTLPRVQSVRDRVHPDDLPVFDAEMQRGMQGGDTDFTFRIVTPTAGLKHLRAVARLMEHAAGRPIVIGTIQDITERKSAEAASKIAAESLNQARLELTHVARVATLSAMTASITHEVSQPISGILTNANTGARMLAADPPNIAGAAETVRRTIRDANRASEVIKRLRAMFAKKAPTLERVDLNEVAQEVIAMSSGELRRSRAVLQTDFAELLPAISADRVQLQQVILNLLLNAADAMAGIEDRPRALQVQTQAHGSDSIQLFVRDSGVGIDPRGIEKLFEAFHTTKAHGLGIGLAISRSIIEAHKGKLWAMPNDGPGATFGFSIPYASDATTAS